MAPNLDPQGHTLNVLGWKDHYETSETKKLKQLRWVPVPNVMKRGYAKLLSRHGYRGLGVWVAILQTASRKDKDSRDGVLDHTLEDLALETRGDIRDLQEILPTLQEIGWLSLQGVDPQGVTSSAGIAGDSPGTTGDSADEGKEGRKGRERREGRNGNPPTPQRGAPKTGGGDWPDRWPKIQAVLRETYGVRTPGLMAKCLAGLAPDQNDDSGAVWLRQQSGAFTTGMVAASALATAHRDAVRRPDTKAERLSRQWGRTVTDAEALARTIAESQGNSEALDPAWTGWRKVEA